MMKTNMVAESNIMDGRCSISEDVLEALKKVYSPLKEKFEDKQLHERLSFALSTPPLTSVLRVNLLKIDILSASKQLQCMLDRQSEKLNTGFVSMLHEHIPDILIVHSKEKFKDVTALSRQVIVDELCGIAVLRGADVFACGILATPPAMVKGDVISVYADLGGQCRRGFKKNYEGRKYFVGNGTALLDRCEIFKGKKVRGVAVKMDGQRFFLPSFAELDPDIFFPQNLPSVLVARNLHPRAGDIILDMCAAPGGKTLHTAMLMENKGVVYAIDKSKSKVRKLKEICDRQQWEIVQCFAFDSTELCAIDGGYPGQDQAPPFALGVFDKIILDPPCSALGQRPQLQCKLTSAELNSFSIYQKKLFDQAVKLLKPGGTLMYSTCTLTVDENENQVAWALDNYKQLKLVPQNLYLGGTGILGHNLGKDECELVQRFDPCRLSLLHDCFRKEKLLSANQDTIGFFIAKFIKSSSR